MRGDDDGDAERPGALLEGPGADAFEAFNAMQTTKRRHFEMLERLDAKRERYGLDPTASEAARLAGLLADHDAQVRRFARAGAELKALDPDGHRRLFGYVGAVTVEASAASDDDSDASDARGPTH